MRRLIRPFLFTVARLGLFLAVVAWIVGQWWDISSGFQSYVHASWSYKGLVFMYHPEDFGYYDGSFYFKVASARSVTWFDGVSEFPPGVIHLSPTWASNGFFAVRNWLVTSTFIAFNLLLHFIYRKRPEAEPCTD